MEAFLVLLAIFLFVMHVIQKSAKKKSPTLLRAKTASRPPQLPIPPKLVPPKFVPPKIRRPILGRREIPPTTLPEPPPIPLPPAAPPLPVPGSVRAGTAEGYVDHLIDVIRVGEPAATRRAVTRLVEVGRPALPALQEAAHDDSPFVRQQVRAASTRILDRLLLAGDPAETVPSPSGVRPDERPEAGKEEEEDVPDALLAEPAAIEPEVADGETVPAPDLRREDTLDADALAVILREAEAEPRFGGRRDVVLEPLAGRSVRFALEVVRTQGTGTFDVSEAYRSGRTVAGRIAGTDVTVAVRLPPATNAEVDALRKGGRLAFVGAYTGWDAIYDRAKFEGEIDEAA